MRWRESHVFDVPFLPPGVGDNVSSARHLSNQIKCVRFNREGTHVAVGSIDSVVRIFCLSGHNAGQEVNSIRVGSHGIVTCMEWVYNEDSHVRDCLVVTMGDGTVAFLHTPSNRVIWEHTIPDESLTSVALCDNHKLFAVAGKRCEIRLYAEEAKREVMVLSADFHRGHSAHRGRIMTLRFIPKLPSRLLSAGLDGQVLLWDVVRGVSLGAIVRGVAPLRDALAVTADGQRLLTASYRKGAPLQVWPIDPSVSSLPSFAASNALPPVSQRRGSAASLPGSAAAAANADANNLGSQSAAGDPLEVPLDGVTSTFSTDPLALLAVDPSQVNTSSLHCARWTPSATLVITGGSEIDAARAFVRRGGIAAQAQPATVSAASALQKGGHVVDSGAWELCGYSELEFATDGLTKDPMRPVLLEAVDIFEPTFVAKKAQAAAAGANKLGYVPSEDPQWVEGVVGAVAAGDRLAIYRFDREAFSATLSPASPPRFTVVPSSEVTQGDVENRSPARQIGASDFAAAAQVESDDSEDEDEDDKKSPESAAYRDKLL